MERRVDGETYGCVKSFLIYETHLMARVERILLLLLDQIRMKFRELLPFLTSRAPPLEMKDRV